MKKSAFLILAVLLALTLLFAACDNGKDPQLPSGERTTDQVELPTETTTAPDTEPHAHAFDEWATIKDATCTEQGEQQRTCACGEVETQSLDALGHTEVVDAAVEPTCTETGLTEGTHCSACDEVLTAQDTIPALGHTEVIDTAVAPTCTEKGLTEGKHCSVCEQVLVEQTVVPALGHSYTDVVTAPTCTDRGYTTHTCDCGDSYVDSYVGALGHTYAEVVTAPTCTDRGYTTYTCDCGDSYVGSYVGMIDHSYGEWYTAVEPTCTATGTKRHDCVNCNHYEVQSIAFTGHSHTAVVTAPTCTERGYTTHTCHCGDSYIDTYVAALGHTEFIDAEVAPTCTATGLTEGKHCSVCNEVLVAQVVVPAMGHSYEAVVTAPTCTEQGYTTHTCHCGDSYVDSYVDAIGHRLGNWYTAIEPTCAELGAERRDCDNCDYHEEQNLAAYGHSYTSVVTPPTCTEEGYTTHTCHCGDSYIDSRINAFGHRYGNWYITIVATCTEDGLERHDCENCDHYEECIILAQGHSYGHYVTAPTCTEQGYTTYACWCGDSFIDENSYVDAIGHRFDEWYVSQEPTCDEQGQKLRYCPYCGTYEAQNIPAHGHSYSEQVIAPTCSEMGYTYHACEFCGTWYKNSYIDAIGHYFDDWYQSIAPSCTLDGTIRRDCSRCDYYEIDVAPPTGHIHSDRVEENYIPPTCTTMGEFDMVIYCAGCNTELNREHYTIEASGHQHIAQYEENRVEPNCTEKGSYELVECCTVCGIELLRYTVEIDALGHDFSEWYQISGPTCIENGENRRNCSRCDGYEIQNIDPIGHSFGDWYLILEPTCIAEGIDRRDCACGAYEEESIAIRDHSYSSDVIAPTCTERGYTKYFCHCGDTYFDFYTDALGHNYEAAVTAPTCSEQGYTTHTCHCGESYVDSYVAALGHNYGAWYVTTEPTCTENGSERHNCARCNHFEEQSVVAPGHNHVSIVTQPTCTEQGYTTHTCHCGDTYIDSYVNALGHTEDEIVVENHFDPTCTEVGGYDNVIYCSVCTEELSREHIAIPALGHNHEAVVTVPTCTEQGYTTHTCHCGDSYVDSYVDALGHNYGAWYVTTEPTCTENGTERRNCARCNHYEEQDIVADGHNHVSVVTAPTCTEQGYTTHTCHCGDSYIDSYTDATGHSHEAVVTAPTCTEQGYTTHTCHCGDSYVDNYVNATGHSYGEWYITTEPTCTENGIERHDCANCDHYEEQSVAVNGHSYTTVVTAPTCTEQGYTIHTCHCGDSYVDSYTEATGHSYGDWYTTTEPSCIKTGLERHDCENCDHYEEQSIVAAGHSHEAVVTDPTCTEQGYTTHTCHCGDSYIDTYVDARHVEGEWIIDQEATKLVDGLKHQICAVCDTTLTEEVIHATGSEGLEYTLNGDGISYSVTGIGTCTDTDVIVPEYYNNCLVTKIYNSAFHGCTSLTSITIPDSVTSIGKQAFYYCTSLTSITIGDSVTSIGDEAFYNCTGLTSITIPEGVTIIGELAFENCSSMTSVAIPSSLNKIGTRAFFGCTAITNVYIVDLAKWCNLMSSASLFSNPLYFAQPNSLYLNENVLSGELVIPNSVTSLRNGAFFGCRELTSVVISDSVTSIGESAFYGCFGLTSVTIPDSVTSIGARAFRGCAGLTSITIPDSVTSIGGDAFNGCFGLTSITIGDSVTSIDGYAFQNCFGLTSITIPDSVTSIGGCAFYGCANLTSITLGDSVTSIGGCAFQNCFGLTSITIPDSVTSIGGDAFYDCTGLTSVYINDIAKWCKIRFGSNQANPLFYAKYLYLDNELVTDLVVPDSVTSIGKYAFSGCVSLKSVTIPNSVTSIGVSAFYGCQGLTSITIPNSVTSIGDSAFYGCQGLTSITIPDGVTSIDHGTFYNCTGLKGINIPDSVTSIGASAFYRCSSLTSINIPNSVTSIDVSAFYGCKGLTSITIGDGVKSIGRSAFDYCSSLTSVHITSLEMWCRIDFSGYSSTPLSYAQELYLNGQLVKNLVIPEGITNISGWAFINCTSLTSVTIPDGVTTIGDWAFFGCSGLTSVTIPDSVTSIGDYAFRGCTGLTSITIPDSVTSIGYQAFYGCSNLTSVTIPDSVTSIGSFAFSGCKGLTSITIGNGVSSIGSSAFYYCTSLTSITIPDGVTSIGERAFYYCTSLTRITIPNSVTSIGDSAFSGCQGLTDVYYTGTEEEWAAMTIGSDNTYLTSVTIHYGEHQHVFSDWVIEIPATCTEEGVRYRVCTVCDGQEEEIIPATGHTASEFYSLGEYCGAQALGYTECVNCYVTLSEFDHSYMTTVTHSTCTEQGTIVHACKNCDSSFTETLPVGGHILGDWVVTTPATCTTPGQKVRYCTTCEQVIETLEIAVVAHKYTSMTTEQGIVYTCSQCGDSYTVETADYITLSFICDGEQILSDLQIAKGTYPELPKPAKEGYVFSGWYLDEELTNMCLDSYTFGADTTLYGAWVEESITTETSTNNVFTQAPLDFTFNVSSEFELTDANLAQYVFVTDMNDASPALYIVSVTDGIYTIGSHAYEPGLTYRVKLNEQVNFADTTEAELWFITKRENVCNIQYDSDTKLIPESGISAYYESEGNCFILFATDILDVGDNAVVYRGEDQTDISMVFTVVMEGTYEGLYYYMIDDADYEAVFDELDYYYSGEVDVSSMEFNANLDEELTQQVLRSSLYANFSTAATTFSGVTIGDYYYELKETPKPQINHKVNKEEKSITFTIKVVAEFERMHVETREVDSVFSITLEMTTKVKIDIESNATRSFKSASVVTTASNTTEVKLFASVNDKKEIDKEELYYFQKLFKNAQNSGSFPDVDTSTAETGKEILIGTLPVVGVPSTGITINIYNVFNFEVVGELGVAVHFDATVTVGVQYQRWHGVSVFSSYKSNLNVTFYMMGKISITDSVKLEIKGSLCGMLHLSADASVGPYFEVGGMLSATLSPSGVPSGVANGFVELGCNVQANVTVSLKVFGINIKDKTWPLIDKQYPWYTLGTKVIPMHFIDSKETVNLDYQCGTTVTISEVIDTSVRFMDFGKMKKKVESPDCEYYLNGTYPGVWLTKDGRLTIVDDLQSETIEIKVVYGSVYKLVTLNLNIIHELNTVPERAPTCTEPGNTGYTFCIQCSKLIEGWYTVIDAPGHSYDDWYTVTEVTCTENGLSRRDCSVCDHYEEQVVVAPGHTDEDYNNICERCEQKILADGLYDANGNMLASWDELVNTYGLDVEKGYKSSTYKTDSASPYYVLTSYTELSGGVILVLGDIETIGAYAFEDCSNLTRIVLPYGVTSIGRSAFSGCTSLMSITIPDNVTSIGEYAFYGCSGLTSINIPDSVTCIRDHVFANCTSLTNVTISDSVISIENYAFYNCTGLTSITIPNSVTSIGYWAFSACISLTSITIPDSVTSIGNYVFCDCAGLATVTIGDGVTSINNSVFKNCTGLTNIVIGAGVTSIGEYAFDRTDLTSITFGNSVKSIGSQAFRDCANLTSVYFIGTLIDWMDISFEDLGANPMHNGASLYFDGELVTAINIPEGITTVNAYAFSDCSGVMSITIPDSVTSIGESAFEGCTSLTSIVIPDSVISIGNFAFSDCTGLTSIVIPDSVTSIGNGAFYGCSGLTSITIPDSVTSIDEYAFLNCTSLTSVFITDITAWMNIEFEEFEANPVTHAHNLYLNGELITEIVIPDSVTSIGNYTFSGCSGLTSITVPDSVTSIGDSAFYGCTGLTSITIPDNVTSIGTSAFSGCTSLMSITIPDNVTSIGEYAFSGCTSLMSITIPDSVTSIGRSAFSGCTSLMSITIPDNVTSIGNYAFSNCTGLTSITLGDSVTSIGNYAFFGCSGLTSITIPDSVTSIGSYAFAACHNLTGVYISDMFAWCKISFDDYIANPLYYARNLYLNGELVTELVIPEDVTSIGSYAFYKCTSLTNIAIPDGVTSIGDYAFSGCTGLTRIAIPDSVTSIGHEAFYNCTSLTYVYYTGTIQEWAEITIGDNNSNLKNSFIHFNWGETTGNRVDQISLNGDVSDWNDAFCEPVRFDQNNLDAWLGEVGEDNGFTVRMTADETYVYFAFDITDYEVFFSDDGQYNGDACQIQMDFNGWCGSSGEFNRAIFYSFGLQEDGTIDITVRCRDDDDGLTVDYSMASDDSVEWRKGEVVGATRLEDDGTGWIAEFAISWETLYRDVSQKFAAVGEEVPVVNLGYEDVYINMLITYLDHEPVAYDSHSITGAWGTSNQPGALGNGDGWYPENAGVKAYLNPVLGQGCIVFN